MGGQGCAGPAIRAERPAERLNYGQFGLRFSFSNLDCSVVILNGEKSSIAVIRVVILSIENI